MSKRLKRKKPEDKEYEVENILNKRLTEGGKFEYFLKWKGFPNSENSWEPTENLNCPELIEAYEKSSGKKRKLKSNKIGAYGSVPERKAEAEKDNVMTAYNNSKLPAEILIKIFGYLPQNELGRIARVCKSWNECVKGKQLWIDVDVYFKWNMGSLNKVVQIFAENLSTCTTRLWLDFSSPFYWLDRLNFENFCMILQKRCPHLQMLILLSTKLSVGLPRAIDICSHFLLELKILTFHDCRFGNHVVEEEYCGISKIEVLDLNSSLCRLKDFKNFSPSKLPHLKKLYLDSKCASDSWLNDALLLQRLQVLQVGNTSDIHKIFQSLLNHALNITVLCLCRTWIHDYDIFFSNSGFPKLHTICLSNTDVTLEGVMLLITSCPCLQNIYVSKELAKEYAEYVCKYAEHVANKCNVKADNICNQPLDVLYEL